MVRRGGSRGTIGVKDEEEEKMKITRITGYQVNLPLHEGSYKWYGGN